MTTPIKSLLTAGALAGLLAAPTALGIDVTMKQGSFQTGNGGEFVALTSQPFTQDYAAVALQTVGGVVGFSTFCLEKNEALPFNSVLAGTLNNRAINGGVDNTEVPNLAGDPISIATAWLYTQFSSGVLVGYDYGTEPYSNSEKQARKDDAKVLQEAFWMLEDEQTLDLSNAYVNLVVNQFGSLAAAKSANDGYYPVAVLNLTQNGNKRQDVLVRVPDGGTTLGMLGAATLAFGMIRRRKDA